MQRCSLIWEGGIFLGVISIDRYLGEINPNPKPNLMTLPDLKDEKKGL